jgi:hypothetical protein
MSEEHLSNTQQEHTGVEFDEEDDFVVNEANVVIPGTATDATIYKESVGSKASGFKSKKRKRPPVRDLSENAAKKIVTEDGVVLELDEESEDGETNQNDEQDEELYDFYAELDSSPGFNDWIKQLTSILDECTIEIKNTPVFQGLSVQCLHQTGSAFASAKYECNIVAPAMAEPTGFDDVKFFNVILKDLQRFICAMNKHSMLIIFRKKGDSGYYIQSGVDTGIPNTKKVSIKIADSGHNRTTVIPSTSINSSFTIELKVDIMKDIIKAIDALQSNSIKFVVFEPEKKKNTPEQIIYFKLSSTGDKGKLDTVFRCVLNTSGEDYEELDSNDTAEKRMNKGTVVRLSEEVVVDDFKLKTIDKACQGTYDLVFLTKMINQMSKICKINLAVDDTSPMILQYNLGDNTYVRFCLAKNTGE